MARRITLPTGKILEFPDTTKQEVIDRVVAKYTPKDTVKPEVPKKEVKSLAEYKAPSEKRRDLSKLTQALNTLDASINTLIKKEDKSTTSIEAQIAEMEARFNAKLDKILKAMTASKKIIRDAAGKITEVHIKEQQND